MNLTEKEVSEYMEFLKEHKKDLNDFVPHLGPRATRFADLVMMVALKREMTVREFSKLFHCGHDTIYSILKVIKSKKLPFKYTERLDCRRIAKLTEQSAKPMTAASLEIGFRRYRKKYGDVMNIATSVAKTIT